MINNRDHKIGEIIEAIKNDLSGANLFGVGPKLLLYRQLLGTRAEYPSVRQFLMSEAHLKLLYDTLEAWDMNVRGARMKSFAGFKASLMRRIGELNHLEDSGQSNQFSTQFRRHLKTTYETLHVMLSKAKLVANAKILHFLFPDLLMPVDRQHVLCYLYGPSGYTIPNRPGSVSKYLEIIDFSFAVMGAQEDWTLYLDDQWNTTVPKMIDNAMVVLARRRANR